MSSVLAAPLLSIGEVARRVGAAPSAIRYWERAGLLEPAERIGGRRRYRPDALTRVGFIRLCQDAGFHIHEIRELLTIGPLTRDDWRPRAERKVAELRDQIARLQTAVDSLEHSLSCPHPALTECPSFIAHVQARAENPTPRAPHT